MIRRENLSYATRRPVPVKRVSPLPQTTPIQRIARNVPVTTTIRRVERLVKPITRPVTRVTPIIKPPSAINRIAKIVPRPITMPMRKITEPITRKAVIRPVTTPFTRIAIERERQEVIRAIAPKNALLKSEQGAFRSTFKPVEVKLRRIDMRVPLGRIAPTPSANPVTKRIGRIVPKVLKRVTPINPIFSPGAKKSIAKPVFRKTPVDVVKAVEKPPIVVTPATKNFLSAVLPGLALFFLKK